MHIHFAAPIALLILSALNTGIAFAHDAPSGWKYPPDCCHNRDCRPISAEWVRESPAVPERFGASPV